jgi:AcrR family transcriptional regulator
VPSHVFTNIDDAELVERRRDQVVAAATELYGRKGFHETTVKEIAQRAGVSAGLIYSYVKTKEDVLYLVLLSVLESYAREIPKALQGVTDPIQRFCAATRAYCQVVGANADASLLAYRETKSLDHEQREAIKDLEVKTIHYLVQCIQDCIAAGYFRSVNVQLAAYRLALLAHGWALKGWYFKKFTTIDQYTEEGLDLFLHALMTPDGWKHYLSTVRDVANK